MIWAPSNELFSCISQCASSRRIAFQGVICQGCKVFDNINSSAVLPIAFPIRNKNQTISKNNQHTESRARTRCTSPSVLGLQNHLSHAHRTYERWIPATGITAERRTCSVYALWWWFVWRAQGVRCTQQICQSFANATARMLPSPPNYHVPSLAVTARALSRLHNDVSQQFVRSYDDKY